MVLDILNAVGDACDVARTALALRALSSEVATMAVDLCDMLPSRERPELLAEMQNLGRADSETTAAYRWAIEQNRSYDRI
jgi:hypothetical protein